MIKAFRKTYFFYLFLIPLINACGQPTKASLSQKKSITQSPSIASKNRLIVLDPGHGGFDIGANSHFTDEKRLTLLTALLVKRYLNRMGYRVIMTRTRDVFIPLKKRASIANETRGNLFVSIHYNAAKSPQAAGIEVFYYPSKHKWKQLASKKLAQKVLSQLLKKTGAHSRGVKAGNFHVIRETRMPAILIEGGFITHPKERNLLREENYRDKIAKAIAEGIDQYHRS